jgi:hypothetical protein
MLGRNKVFISEGKQSFCEARLYLNRKTASALALYQLEDFITAKEPAFLLITNEQPAL